MYDLGISFKVDIKKSKTPSAHVYRGSKYRISILSDSLVRLEYSENGLFEDRPTELVLNRNFESPMFSVKEDKKYIEVKTTYFTLSYIKNSHFKGNILNPSSNLRIEVFNSDKVWYYNHPEVRNYKAPHTLLSDKKDYIKSLYALNDPFVMLQTLELFPQINFTLLSINLSDYLNNCFAAFLH